MVYFWIVFVGVVVMFVALYIIFSNEAKLHDQIKNRISDVSGVRRAYISLDSQLAFGFDNKNNQLVVLKGIIRRKFHISILPYSKIIAVELKEGNLTIANSVTTNNSLLRGVAGFALAGGVGAIIGGLSSKSKTRTTTDEKVKSISVEIYTSNYSFPILRMKTFHSSEGVSTDSGSYNKALDQATRLYGKFKRIIADNNDARIENSISDGMA